MSAAYTLWVKKGTSILLPITLADVDGFSNFFSLLNSRNLQQTECHIAHHTLNVLLHYLVKWHCHKQPFSYQNNAHNFGKYWQMHLFLDIKRGCFTVLLNLKYWLLWQPFLLSFSRSRRQYCKLELSMAFTADDRILIKNLCLLKGYNCTRLLEFPEKDWGKKRTQKLLRKIPKTCGCNNNNNTTICKAP